MTIAYISAEDTKKPIPIYITHIIKKMELICKKRKQARENKKERGVAASQIYNLLKENENQLYKFVAQNTQIQ